MRQELEYPLWLSDTAKAFFKRAFDKSPRHRFSLSQLKDDPWVKQNLKAGPEPEVTYFDEKVIRSALQLQEAKEANKEAAVCTPRPPEIQIRTPEPEQEEEAEPEVAFFGKGLRFEVGDRGWGFGAGAWGQL